MKIKFIEILKLLLCRKVCTVKEFTDAMDFAKLEIDKNDDGIISIKEGILIIFKLLKKGKE